MPKGKNSITNRVSFDICRPDRQSGVSAFVSRVETGHGFQSYFAMEITTVFQTCGLNEQPQATI